MDDVYKEAIANIAAMTAAARQARQHQELASALAQRLTPPSAPTPPVDPGEDLRNRLREQRDALAGKLGVMK